MNTVELIDIAMENKGIPSDNQLAGALEIGRSTISNYRNRGSQLDDDVALKIAPLVAMDEGEVLCQIHAERAKDPVVKAAWLRVAEIVKKANKGAVSLAVIITLITPLSLGMSSYSSRAAAHNDSLCAFRRNRRHRSNSPLVC